MSDRPQWVDRLAPPLLVVALAVALVVGRVDALQLASPAGGPADDVGAALDGIGRDELVLVGFDPDIGTYAEIRPTVRALLGDLLDRGANLVFVSLTPEGRALSLAELQRLRDGGVDAERLVDIGFVPGAEAGLVALAGAFGGGATGLAASIAEPLGGSAVRVAVVVGGNDLGPRSWVEQVAPRVEGLELVAVAPTVLLPELRPYLASGQLRALLATPRDGAAYAATVAPGGGEAGVLEEGHPTALALTIGLLAGLVWLGSLLLGRIAASVRGAGAREAG